MIFKVNQYILVLKVNHWVCHNLKSILKRHCLFFLVSWAYLLISLYVLYLKLMLVRGQPYWRGWRGWQLPPRATLKGHEICNFNLFIQLLWRIFHCFSNSQLDKPILNLNSLSIVSFISEFVSILFVFGSIIAKKNVCMSWVKGVGNTKM